MQGLKPYLTYFWIEKLFQGRCIERRRHLHNVSCQIEVSKMLNIVLLCLVIWWEIWCISPYSLSALPTFVSKFYSPLFKYIVQWCTFCHSRSLNMQFMREISLILTLFFIYCKQGVRRGGFGVEPPLSLIFYENFVTCANEIKYFRILFTC